MKGTFSIKVDTDSLMTCSCMLSFAFVEKNLCWKKEERFIVLIILHVASFENLHHF